MNAIRQIQALNKQELENSVSPEASWHADYRDTAYIYIGGLPFDLSEGDILTIFSQFGEPVHINLVRDKDTGKSRGFAFLKYEDQRSTDLAVDNLGGATVMGRMLRVDHTRYKRREEEGVEDNIAMLDGDDGGPNTKAQRDGGDDDDDRRGESRSRRARPQLKEEKELARLIEEHDDEDPMKEFLIQEKREEVESALALAVEKPKSSRRRDRSTETRDRHRHRHRRHHHRRHSRERSRSREKRSSRHARSHSRSPSRERRHRRSRRDRS